MQECSNGRNTKARHNNSYMREHGITVTVREHGTTTVTMREHSTTTVTLREHAAQLHQMKTTSAHRWCHWRQSEELNHEFIIIMVYL